MNHNNAKPLISIKGYVFKSPKEIMPYLEDSETGPSVQWAKKQGKRIYLFGDEFN